MAPARALRRGHRPDLRRLQRQAPAVERAAERNGGRLVAVPARLDDRRLDARELERRLEPRAAAARVDDDVDVAARSCGRTKRHAERARGGVLVLVDVDELDLGAAD